MSYLNSRFALLVFFIFICEGVSQARASSLFLPGTHFDLGPVELKTDLKEFSEEWVEEIDLQSRHTGPLRQVIQEGVGFLNQEFSTDALQYFHKDAFKKSLLQKVSSVNGFEAYMPESALTEAWKAFLISELLYFGEFLQSHLGIPGLVPFSAILRRTLPVGLQNDQGTDWHFDNYSQDGDKGFKTDSLALIIPIAGPGTLYLRDKRSILGDRETPRSYIEPQPKRAVLMYGKKTLESGEERGIYHSSPVGVVPFKEPRLTIVLFWIFNQR